MKDTLTPEEMARLDELAWLDIARLDIATARNLAIQEPVSKWLDEAQRALDAEGVPREVVDIVIVAAHEIVGSLHADGWRGNWEAQADFVVSRLCNASRSLRTAIQENE